MLALCSLLCPTPAVHTPRARVWLARGSPLHPAASRSSHLILKLNQALTTAYSPHQLDARRYYSLFTLFMLVTFECTVVGQRLRNLNDVRRLQAPKQVRVCVRV